MFSSEPPAGDDHASVRPSLVCIVEDSAAEPLCAEHGLSFVVASGEGRVLFDTGQSPEALLANARALGEDLSRVDTVVLSHGHYDHVGGLPGVPSPAGGLTVVAHPAVFEPRWRRDGAGGRCAVGPPWLGSAAMKGVRWIRETRPTEVLAGIWTTGEIPRRHGGEAIEDRLFVEMEQRELPDHFPDDQALVLQVDGGVVVVLGCCHAGLMNTLEHVRSTWQQPIVAVVGGTHLAPMPVDVVDHVVRYLEQLGPREIIIGHCTGEAAYDRISRGLGSRVARLCAGLRRSW